MENLNYIALGSFVVYHTHNGINDGMSEMFFWFTAPIPIPFMVHALYVYANIVIDNSQCELIPEHIAVTVCAKTGLHLNLPVYACCGKF